MESLIDIEDFPGRSDNQHLPDDDDHGEDHKEGRQQSLCSTTTR